MESFKYVEFYVGSTVTRYETEEGRLHREDGPAYITEFDSGSKIEAWYFNDRLQRYGGPAVINDEQLDYWIHGNYSTVVVEKWLKEHEYEWDTMSDIEKWELELFMRSI